MRTRTFPMWICWARISVLSPEQRSSWTTDKSPQLSSFPSDGSDFFHLWYRHSNVKTMDGLLEICVNCYIPSSIPGFDKFVRGSPYACIVAFSSFFGEERDVLYLQPLWPLGLLIFWGSLILLVLLSNLCVPRLDAMNNRPWEAV